jgi:hypothetical protein
MSDAHPLGRQIRVFISSTFRDMQADRDVLVKKVFPQLRKLCESRAVAWTEVDLRWGITSEQQAEGKVLPYCLAEIERSRPFFIGLLGERYGWVPQSIPVDLVEQQPWLREHLEHSVTELEILHGVLNNPALADRALFYFRDPAYLAAAPPEKAAEFIETGPDAERMRKKLTALKERIRTAAEQKRLKYPPRENYANPEALGDLILADFTRIIEELYPPTEVPDPLDQEANRHEEYARSRRDLYIARPRYFELLDQHIESANPPLVLTGESGCGKTALLANWVERYRESYPQDLIIQHYIGSTPDSADWMRVVTRILGELKRGFNLSDDLPSTPEKLRPALDEWFVKTATGRRIVLVLDGLNQLEDRDNAQELAWLPHVFPTNVRVLASSLRGRAFDATQQRKWPTMAVELLNAEERRQIVTGYLALGGRTASKELLSAIEAQAQTLNPLYLRAFLDEIRVFGRFEELPATIENYLRAATPSDLYRLIIQRWVRDYPEARVADALRLVWAARRGLAEAELMDLLGYDGEPMARGYWTPFYLTAERSLAMRAGLLNFGHDYLRAAVQQELLPNEASEKSVRLQLAGYFEKIDEPTDRKAEELPWLLRQAEAWEKLKGCLTDLLLFLKLRQGRRKWELQGYWIALEDRFDPAQCYATALEANSRTRDDDPTLAATLSEIASFHKDAGRYGPAEPLYRRALEASERLLGPQHVNTLAIGNNLAELLSAKGDYAAAESLYRRTLASLERAVGPKHPDTLSCATNLAELLVERGDDGVAEPLYRRTLAALEREVGPEHPATLVCMNNLALLLYSKGDSGAEPLFRRALDAFERALGPEHPDTLLSAMNLGYFLNGRGDYAAAEPLFRRALESEERVLGREHPRTLHSLRSLAELLESKGDYVAAESLFRRALAASERVLGPEHRDTLRSVSLLAAFLERKGDYAAAEPLYRRALAASERALGPEHPTTLASISSLAVLLTRRGDYALAEPLHRRALEASERLHGPEHPYTLRSANNLALLLMNKRDYASAGPLCHRVLDASDRILGHEHPNTLVSVFNLATLLQSKGDYAGAEAMYRRALAGKERTLGPEHPDTLGTISSLAKVLASKGEYAAAEPLYRRALEARERVLGPEHPDTLGTINELAVVLASKGDYAAAEPLHRRALEARERVLGPEHRDTLGSVNDLAVLLKSQRDYTGAEPLYRRAWEGQERVLGPEHPNTLASMHNLAVLLSCKGDHAGAEPLYRRALERQERVLGPEHPDTLTTIHNLGKELASKGDYAAAEALYRRGLEGRERVLGREHPHTLISVNDLAELLRAKGDYAAAEPLYRRALEARERVLGSNHTDTLATMASLIDFLASRGREEEASSLRRQYIRRVADSEASLPALTLRQVALECYRSGDYPRAEKLYRRVLEKGFEVPDTHVHLARAYLMTDRDSEARREVELGEQHKAQGKPYLAQRIRYFQALLGLLEGEVPTAALKELKKELARPDALMEWDLKAVLERSRPRLSAEAYDLLVAIAAAINDRAAVERLNQLPMWPK